MLTRTIQALLMAAIMLVAMLVLVGSTTHAQGSTGVGGSASTGAATPPSTTSIKDGVKATCPGGTCPTASTSVDSLVASIIDIFSWVVGVVSVIMVIYGGFRYVTSGGDAGKVTSAKNTIVYALVGLVIVALAQVIVLFVLGNVT